MVAAEVDPWTVREALDAGAAGFIGKANTADILTGAVRSLLRGEVFLCSDARAALQRADQCADAAGDLNSEGPSPWKRLMEGDLRGKGSDLENPGELSRPMSTIGGPV